MRALLAPCLAGALGSACLPSDTRPPPGEIQVTASSSEATREGIPLTVDDYQITFERVLMDVGQPYVGDDNDTGGSCSEYSSPFYTRVFDFVHVTAPQKVGVAFAIGHCPFEFTVRFPNPDAIIGQGASAADTEFMRTPGSDAYSMDAGVSIYVVGSAVRGDVTKHFAWPFRERIGYRDCWVPDGSAMKKGLDIAGEGSLVVNIEMQAEALFRDQLDPALAELRFQPFADADADADDEITLDELDAVKLADLTPHYAYPFDPTQPSKDAPLSCGDADGNPVSVTTLGDYAYCALAPSVARFEGTGACRTFTGRRTDD